MSKQLIEQYYRDLERVKRAGQTLNETSIRSPFYRLLDEYCKVKDLVIVTEASLNTAIGKKRPDGTIKDKYGINDWGYWESKDTKDDLEIEIQNKFNIGYPQNNILFENSVTAILYQDGQKIVIDMRNDKLLDKLLKGFVNYERPEIREFHKAIEAFKENIKQVVPELQSMLEHQNETNEDFVKKRNDFWELCKNSINPEISLIDIREMLIQHVLTEDLFVSIFGNSDFHRENNIAKSLENVLHTFYYGKVKQTFISGIRHYYETIRAKVSNIPILSEKQKVLKIVYEEFYRAYNPKGADNLGVVYTPNEIVRFMIESTDFLTIKNFDKGLSDENVEILDPATGTGTFITDLMEYIPKHKLKYKYQNEIHCNELSILPYYIANLNIEYTYNQLMDNAYEPFNNICFVDTLVNVFHINATKYLKKGTGIQTSAFGSFSAENIERINTQNQKKISVIIGNPPYNANQQNWNDFNPNRTYEHIDKRIQDTYIAESTAQKTKLYDMYARFVRWASDRIEENGVIAFVSNNSFLDTRTYDGFRKVIEQEFNEIYIIDLKGDARKSGDLWHREGGKIFGQKARVGIAIYFLIKKENQTGCKIYYTAVDDYLSSNEKINYLNENKFKDLLNKFKIIKPTPTNDWINLGNNEFNEYTALYDKATTKDKAAKHDKAIFKFVSLGIVTNRDEWVYDFSQTNLNEKCHFFVNKFNEFSKNRNNNKDFTPEIKWSENLINHYKTGKKLKFSEDYVKQIIYRPFTKKNYYGDKLLSDRLTANHQILFGENLDKKNPTICITVHRQVPFCVQATDILFDLGYGARDTRSFSLYRYKDDKKIDNITDWGLNEFRSFYNDKTINKEHIFYYTYAVLHHSQYISKFQLNLKKEMPKLPFYDNFHQLAKLGEELFNLHLNFETVEPFNLEEVIKDNIPNPSVKLKADKLKNQIIIDDKLTLLNVPKQAWNYKLGNQSAIEWVLEQYKEKKIKDKSIADKIKTKEFKSYKFSEHKENVVDLIKRICTVSIKTVSLIEQIDKHEI
jgi:predicted helicase